MALLTYSDLQTQVANWIARSDLTSNIPDFVTLFEAAANRRLRVRAMETSTTLTPSSGAVTLPTDYIAWRRVTWTGAAGLVDLEFRHPGWLQGAYPDAAQGTPQYFTIEGTTLTVRPKDDTALTFDYYAKIAALSGTVNWLYSTYPDAYLFGTLTEAYAFMQNADAAGLWKARRDEVLEEVSGTDFQDEGHLVQVVHGPTP